MEEEYGWYTLFHNKEEFDGEEKLRLARVKFLQIADRNGFNDDEIAVIMSMYEKRKQDNESRKNMFDSAMME